MGGIGLETITLHRYSITNPATNPAIVMFSRAALV